MKRKLENDHHHRLAHDKFILDSSLNETLSPLQVNDNIRRLSTAALLLEMSEQMYSRAEAIYRDRGCSAERIANVGRTSNSIALSKCMCLMVAASARLDADGCVQLNKITKGLMALKSATWAIPESALYAKSKSKSVSTDDSSRLPPPSGHKPSSSNGNANTAAAAAAAGNGNGVDDDDDDAEEDQKYVKANIQQAQQDISSVYKISERLPSADTSTIIMNNITAAGNPSTSPRNIYKQTTTSLPNLLFILDFTSACKTSIADTAAFVKVCMTTHCEFFVLQHYIKPISRIHIML